MNNMYGNPVKIISQKLNMVSSQYTDLASSKMEIQKLMKGILSHTPCLKNNKGVVNRVYRKTDSSQEAVLYCYFNLNELGEQFYYLDGETNGFVSMSREDFEKNFSCYEKDLIAMFGRKNPWEIKEIVTKERHLETSSGSIPVDRSDER